MKKTRGKILSLSIIIAMVIGLLPQMSMHVFAMTNPSGTWQEDGAVAEGFEGNGEGTALDPYIIKTAGQLAYLAKNVNNSTDYSGKYISLASNIDLQGRNWIPIGKENRPFAGNFNGNGYVISNLTANDFYDDGYEGLFGYNTGIIKKVGVKNVDILSDGDYAGGFVGYNKDNTGGNGGQIINCYVKGGTVHSNGDYTGGFAGYNDSYYVGIENCYSTVDVTGSDYVGGFGGYNQIGDIANNFATGTATATTGSINVGGFFNGTYGNMQYNYYVDNADKKGNSGNDDADEKVKHIDDIAKLYGDSLLSLDWQSGAWDTVSVWKTVEGDTPELLTPIVTWADYADNTWISTEEAAGRDGSTEAKAYQIKDAADLAEMAVLVNKGNLFDEQFIKVADGVTKIDLGAHEWKTAGVLLDFDASFSGTFDGNNAEITNMTMSERTDRTKGLFGVIGPNSCIKNLKLTKVSFTIKKTSEFVGCVASVNMGGTISNVTVSGDITGNIIYYDDSSELTAIGGIAGIAMPDGASDYGLIEQCASYVDIDVNSTVDYEDREVATLAGGIAALLFTDSTIQNCYNRGDVLIKTVLIEDKYCIAGGICGSNNSGKTVKYCYNSATVAAINASGDGKGYAGQIIGVNVGAVKGCFFDSSVTANEGMNAIGFNEIGGGTDLVDEDNYSKTAIEMKNQSTFTTGFANSENAWDFTNVWKITSENDGYPILQATTFFDAETPTTGGGGSSHNNNSSSKSDNNTISVEQDGKATKVSGTESTKTDNGLTTTTIAADDNAIQNLVNKGKNGTVITLPVSGNADVVIGQLNGQTVKDMEKKEAVLEIKKNNVTYTLPASHINIEAISAEIGKQVALKDIKVSVTISESKEETVKIVQDTANKNNYQIVVKPVEFEITCTSGDKTVSVSKFNGYVERAVAIPEGIDPSKITTGVVLNADGTFYHVPTAIVAIDGKYYAKINSLTNSTYSVIYNQVELKDVTNHWAKEAIHNMGSRLVISGVGNNTFEPDREITRAEFAAIMVRALGLKPGMGSNSFEDVNNSVWYADYIKTATDYQIITGYGKDKFGPMDKITREQAMTMIARAMKLTGLNPEIQDSEVSSLLANYTDGADASAYAKTSLAACLKTGVITGRNGTTIAPRDCITRAEVAVIVERLLQKSNLI